MKSLFNSLSILLILVIGSNSILSGFSGLGDEQWQSFEQDILTHSQVDGDFNFFLETAYEKIIVPSIKFNGSVDVGKGLISVENLGVVEGGLLHLDWYKKKIRFFDVQKLLYPFHFFL